MIISAQGKHASNQPTDTAARCLRFAAIGRFLTLLAGVLAVFPGNADATCTVPGDVAATSGGQWLPGADGLWPHGELPGGAAREFALTQLDYDTEPPRVMTRDLDDDGRDEMFVAPPAGRLCGNAGCPYVLLSADAQHVLGEFFGTLALLDARTRGFRDIVAASHVDPRTTRLERYAFDGGVYRPLAQATLSPCAWQQWQRRVGKGRATAAPPPRVGD